MAVSDRVEPVDLVGAEEERGGETVDRGCGPEDGHPRTAEGDGEGKGDLPSPHRS